MEDMQAAGEVITLGHADAVQETCGPALPAAYDELEHLLLRTEAD